MTYDEPLLITSKPVGIVGIKHGVTEVSLSDGRIVRLTVHVEGLKPVADKIDISCSIVTEVMVAPSVPIMDQHESVQ